MASDNHALMTEFAGLTLASPIIAASAPPTESVKGILECARAGAGAVVTKSIVDYDRANWPDIPRRVYRDKSGLWIQGSFASETLTLREGVEIIAAVRDKSSVPIIASVGVPNFEGGATIETAAALVEAGADLIHFDLFYLPQPRCSDGAIEGLRKLFAAARNHLTVPFGPKLNIDIPAYRFASSFSAAEVDCVFALDSIRVPPPLLADATPAIPAWRGGLECSLFGEWQRPIALQYTRAFAEAGLPSICTGGGLRSAADVLEAVMLGAASAQVATQIIIHGYDWIRRTNEQLEISLARPPYRSIREATAAALKVRSRDAPEQVSKVIAVVDESRCRPCGVCTRLAFCPFISERQDGIPEIADACYGCGLCETFCPHDGAIRMEPAE